MAKAQFCWEDPLLLDAQLSEDELPERLQRAFARIDANGNGFVEESEFKASMDRFGGKPGKAKKSPKD